ncbi:hypothetical protein HA402_007356 [Bradysia odoriphaga]|nr:hypothetical protein HA402_007356 [Bradysia odoriphaga]
METPVNHVQLPPWAKDSPEYFVETFRKALESDYVSQNLNHWIDLIFGYKQRGEEAIKANNLFFHLCYEGSVDLHETNDLRARYALEKKISEFGQIPKQLFDKPHVPRTRSPSLKETSDIAECGSTKSRLKDHSQNVVSYAIVNEQTAGKDESLQLFDMKWNRQAIHKCESVDFYHFEWSTFAKTFVTETSTKADVLFGLIHFVLVKVHRLAARGGDDDNGVGSTLLPHYWKCSATQYLSRYSTLTGDFVTLRGNLENDEIELELVTENKARTTRLKVDKIESIEKDAFLCDHCPSYLQIFSQISKDLCLPKKPNWQTHNDESNGWRGVLSGIHHLLRKIYTKANKMVPL